uniref:RNase H type-1 domain-containing protein n=1 Tax=Panagrellus redivivus TaxID=6233 RepID=A0A7E4ZXN2_PANRE
MLPLLTYDTICERSIRYRTELRIKRSYNCDKASVPVGNELLQRIIRLQREVDRRGVEIDLLRENLNSSSRNYRDVSTKTDDSLFPEEQHYTFDRFRWSRIAVHPKRRRLSPNSRSPQRPFTAPSRLNSGSEGFVDRNPVSPVLSIKCNHIAEPDSKIQDGTDKKLTETINLDLNTAKIENENAKKVKVSPIRRAATSIRHYFKRITHPHVPTVINESPEEDFDQYRKTMETTLAEQRKMTVNLDRLVREKDNSRFKDDGIILHSSCSASETPREHSIALQKQRQQINETNVAKDIGAVPINAEVKAALTRHAEAINNIGNNYEDESSRPQVVYQMYHPPRWPTIIISTDASDSALGAVHTDPTRKTIIDSASRGLDIYEKQKSSNVRELLAIKFAIETFMVDNGVNSAILFTDSQNAIRIIQNGLHRNSDLHIMVTEITNLVRQHQLQIFLKWIPRELNKLADSASREVDFDDWQIRPELFETWNRKYGPCNVDRFATHLTNKLPVFWSKYPCPGASGVDSLSVYWSEARGLRCSDVNWCVPPEDLLIPCITHIMSHPCRGILVMPDWKSHESSKLLAQGVRDGWAKIVDQTKRKQHVIVPVLDGFGPFKSPKLNFPMLCVKFDTFALYDETRFHSNVHFTLQ